MLSDESDATLVRFAKNGDRSAYAVLFHRHETTLRALCHRTLADSTLADDVVQDAAIQAMLSLDRLRDTNRFGPWVCGIGLNLCRRLLRERTRPLAAAWSLETLTGGRWVEEPTAPATDPEDLALEAELAARVRRAVVDLPHGQRASVLLFYLSGLTYAETAAQLGIEVSAVKTRLHKARSALRRQLEDVWNERKMPVPTETYPSVPVRVAIFYAIAVVDYGRKRATVDARPSDAINLALSVGVPISVEPAVFEAAAKRQASTQPEPDLYAQDTQGARDIAGEVQASWKGPGTLARQP
jgi:RNA polymerase sigma factor (sigma-70 family)